jgi:hypothetical protein
LDATTTAAADVTGTGLPTAKKEDDSTRHHVPFPVVPDMNQFLQTGLGLPPDTHAHDTSLLTSLPKKPHTKQTSTNYCHLKECKIRGKIGDPGEKDTLGYYGLLSEIKERELEGYKPERIVGAVINAIMPGNIFKRRLEMKRNLEGTISLDDLRKMLRTHYQERNSNTILLELQKAVQGSAESATTFCNRLIVLRDEVQSRSAEEGTMITPQYLRKRFLQSFQTGLRNGNIRNKHLKEGLAWKE